MDRIRAFLEDKEPEMMGQLESLVRRETPSDGKDLLDGFADVMTDAVGEMEGFKAQVVKNRTSGNHVLSRRRGSAGKQLLILGHFDTVWPRATIKGMPFAVRGDRAFGPGVFDMKSGLVIGLWALKAIEAHDELPPISFLMNSDEEVGSPTSRPIIEREAKKSRAVLVLEPSQGGALKTARKGVGMFHVEVKGRAAHAGLDFFKGISAIKELASVIDDLYSLVDEKRGITVNVGVVKGGSTGNVVAEKASAEVDLRVWTQDQADEVIPKIMNVRPHDKSVRISVEGGMNRPPMPRSAANQKLFRIAKKVAARAGLSLAESSSGGGSDGNFCASVGVPVLDGLGAVGDGAHAASEYIFTSSIVERSALLANLILELSKPDIDL